jgi:hypothetical protein
MASSYETTRCHILENSNFIANETEGFEGYIKSGQKLTIRLLHSTLGDSSCISSGSVCVRCVSKRTLLRRYITCNTSRRFCGLIVL